jgi:hypothetical protein
MDRDKAQKHPEQDYNNAHTRVHMVGNVDRDVA